MHLFLSRYKGWKSDRQNEINQWLNLTFLDLTKDSISAFMYVSKQTDLRSQQDLSNTKLSTVVPYEKDDP
jgi:hypothetical protein